MMTTTAPRLDGGLGLNLWSLISDACLALTVTWICAAVQTVHDWEIQNSKIFRVMLLTEHR